MSSKLNDWVSDYQIFHLLREYSDGTIINEYDILPFNSAPPDPRNNPGFEPLISMAETLGTTFLARHLEECMQYCGSGSTNFAHAIQNPLTERYALARAGFIWIAKDLGDRGINVRTDDQADAVITLVNTAYKECGWVIEITNSPDYTVTSDNTASISSEYVALIREVDELGEQAPLPRPLRDLRQAMGVDSDFVFPEIEIPAYSMANEFRLPELELPAPGIADTAE